MPHNQAVNSAQAASQTQHCKKGGTMDGPNSGGGDSLPSFDAAIQDTDWLMRVRVHAAELLSHRQGTPELEDEARYVLSGLLEDLQSGYDMTGAAFAMFALTYVLRRDEDSKTGGDGALLNAALRSAAQAIIEDGATSLEAVDAYVLGFIHGISAAVKNIHMNA